MTINKNEQYQQKPNYSFAPALLGAKLTTVALIASLALIGCGKKHETAIKAGGPMPAMQCLRLAQP